MLRHNAIYAAFPSVRDAERAAGALLDHGVRAASVSFIVPPGADAPPIVAGTPHMPGAMPVSPTYVPTDLPVPDVNIPAPAPDSGYRPEYRRSRWRRCVRIACRAGVPL